MKTSLVYYVLLFFCLSCAAIKKTENDPFIGKYKMTVFNVDGVGDVPAVLTIDKEWEEYYQDRSGVPTSQAEKVELYNDLIIDVGKKDKLYEVGILKILGATPKRVAFVWF